jgi:hypothetical protein
VFMFGDAAVADCICMLTEHVDWEYLSCVW